MNKLRAIHLFLGCLFPPMLIFFVLTGALQTFDLHERHNDGSQPPGIVDNLSEVHKHQRWPTEGERIPPSTPFKIFVVFMSIGFILSSILGIVMAFKSSKNKMVVWTCLLMGILLPVFFLWMARGFR